MKIPSPDEIDAKFTRSAGGWTRAQLAEWGVTWPPPKGWKTHLRYAYEASHPEVQKAKAEFASDSTWPPPWYCSNCEKFGRDCLCEGSTNDLYNQQNLAWLQTQTLLFKD
jgi:hypothetical protein